MRLFLLILPTVIGCSAEADRSNTAVNGGASAQSSGGSGIGDSSMPAAGDAPTTAGTSSVSAGGEQATAGTSSVLATGGASSVTRKDPYGDYATCSPDAPAPSDGNALFVSASAGVDDEAHGTALAPLKTANYALAVLNKSLLPDDYVSKHKFIILDEGVYSAMLKVPAYVSFTLVGGWKFDGTTWKRDCEDGYRSRTVIGGDDAMGVYTPGLDRPQPAGFYGLTIKTKPEGATVPGKTGESLIGVSVLGHTDVTLVDVDIVVGRAGNGGAVTQPGAAGNVACDGRTCPGGATPAAGANGASATWSGSDGSPGNPGNNGPNGLPGTPGGEMWCATSCGGQCASSPSTCSTGNVSMAGAGSGLCGCGGLGGAGGPGGKGGGEAIGVMHDGQFSDLVILNSSIVVGGGGDGSSGGPGGAGGPGTSGTAGNPANCSSCKASTTAGDPACACQLTPSVIPGGAAGSAGAPGSAGGNGGDGAGGDAWAVLKTTNIGSYYPLDLTQFTVSVGPAGKGAGTAANGRSGNLLVR